MKNLTFWQLKGAETKIITSVVTWFHYISFCSFIFSHVLDLFNPDIYIKKYANSRFTDYQYVAMTSHDERGNIKPRRMRNGTTFYLHVLDSCRFVTLDHYGTGTLTWQLLLLQIVFWLRFCSHWFKNIWKSLLFVRDFNDPPENAPYFRLCAHTGKFIKKRKMVWEPIWMGTF